MQGDHKYTINITHTLPNDSRCFSPPPSLYELWVSHICSPSIIAVWRARWKAAGGERQHLQSNREEQCEISGRGSFPHARGQGIRRWGSLPQTLNTSHWHPDASSMQTHPSHVSVSRGVKLCVYPHSVTALWSACYATAVEVLLGGFAKVSPWVVDVLLKVVGGGNYCFSVFFVFFLLFFHYIAWSSQVGVTQYKRRKLQVQSISRSWGKGVSSVQRARNIIAPEKKKKKYRIASSLNPVGQVQPLA